MLYNRIYHTNPVVLHSPGDYFLWPVLVNQLHVLCPRRWRISDLTIITWNNQAQPGVFERSLDYFGLSYLVLGRHLRDWKNFYKLRLTCDALEKIRTPYVLGVDSFDAMLVGNPMLLIDLLGLYKAKIVFNATNLTYCSSNSLIALCEGYYPHPFCHLNAGAWIADVRMARQFFGEALAIEWGDAETMVRNMGTPVDEHDVRCASEQLRVKKVFEKMIGDVTIDYRCQAFQLLNSTEICKNAVRMIKWVI